jgi:aspartate/methionine/tyrosine aminotransferase
LATILNNKITYYSCAILIILEGLSIVPVPTMDYQTFDESSSSSSTSIPEHAYYPNRASLDAAVANSKEQNGVTPRILLLSHPQNPLGICYPPEVVTEIVEWCRDHEIHLVSDEIYAGSIYRPDQSNFVSTLELASSSSTTENNENENGNLGIGPYIHLVYALSKDFALSGLRVGASYSENPEIRLPLQKLNDLCCVSSQTQLLVERMMTTTATASEDDTDNEQLLWTQRFLAKNHERLRKRGDAWHQCLDELGIPHLKATAGLFVWMDFSEFLPSLEEKKEDGNILDIDERERVLYLELLMDYGLLFTPGRSMKNERPGFFRCVFSAANDEEFQLGMARLRKYVQAKRGAP